MQVNINKKLKKKFMQLAALAPSTGLSGALAARRLLSPVYI